MFTDQILTKIEDRLNELLVNNDNLVLLEAMRYSSLNGGKRVRPFLVMAAGKISQAQSAVLLDIGVAIELIHCYSLIHDDLPAMDDDDLRRGLPTCHKQYGEAMAILAGDALQAQAFVVLSSDSLRLDCAIKLKIINLVASSAGVNGMVGGQALDLLSTGTNLTLPQLQHMHIKKTGALISAAILSGYLAGANCKPEIYDKLVLIANNIGLLFQITDDILDATADTNTLGKTANKDWAANKATYVNILGLEKAQHMADNLYNTTIEMLRHLSQSEELTTLTHFVYNRSN
ncbi:MAG: farnesyl diphosphate synthase [Pseudomonadota bacterium]|nr:farnesyl diphosphate synthase [Pseudomonadota bacterium]